MNATEPKSYATEEEVKAAKGWLMTLTPVTEYVREDFDAPAGFASVGDALLWFYRFAETATWAAVCFEKGDAWLCCGQEGTETVCGEESKFAKLTSLRPRGGMPFGSSCNPL